MCVCALKAVCGRNALLCFLKKERHAIPSPNANPETPMLSDRYRDEDELEEKVGVVSPSGQDLDF